MHETKLLILDAAAAAQEVDAAAARLEAAKAAVDAAKADVAASKAAYDEKIAACESAGLTRAAAKKAAEALNEVFSSVGIVAADAQPEPDARGPAEAKAPKRRRRKDETESEEKEQPADGGIPAAAADPQEVVPGNAVEGTAVEEALRPDEVEETAVLASAERSTKEAVEVGVEEVGSLIGEHIQGDDPRSVAVADLLHAVLRAGADAAVEAGATGYAVGDFLKDLSARELAPAGDHEVLEHAASWFRGLVDDLENGRAPTPLSWPADVVEEDSGIDEAAFAEPSFVDVSDDVTFGGDDGFDGGEAQEDIASMNFLSESEEDVAEDQASAEALVESVQPKAPPKFTPPAFLKNKG